MGKLSKMAAVGRELRSLRTVDDPRARIVARAAIRASLPSTRSADAMARDRLAQDDSELPFDDRTIVVADFSSASSKSPVWTRFLTGLVAGVEARSVVELGGAAGVSAVAMTSALAPGGQLWTIEARTASVAPETLASAGLADRATVVEGWFDDVLPGVIEQADPIDLVFIDGDHYEEPTLRYFEQLAPHMSPTGIMVVDDIHWSESMERAWARLRTHDRAAFTVDLSGVGVVAVA